MGSGVYSTLSRGIRAESEGYATKSINETFSQRNINSAMNPYGITFRESRDSEEHPNSVPIIIALDVTGSMGSVPHFLVKKGLPDIMDSIIQKGIPDPQVLFLGIGDHECDDSPLQVGQFESSDELLDKWLTDVWLEGGGGGNSGESYMLAWYFAAMHTELDCLEKRNKKGFLFTIGDEPVLNNLPANDQKKLMGPGQYQNYTSEELFALAREKYHVFHVHVTHTASGARQRVIDGWKQIASDNLLIASKPEEIAGIISDTVIKETKSGKSINTLQKDVIQEDISENNEGINEEEPML